MQLKKILNKIEENKEKIQEFRPLKLAEIQELDNYFKIGTTYSSNALEGNTLTLNETKILLENGLTVSGKPIKDCYEATGHGEAYDFMIKLARGGALEITEEIIKKLHFLFYNKQDSEEAGNYRSFQVFISGTEYIPPIAEDIPSLMEGFLLQLKKNEENLHPVLLAAYAHKKLVDIHPFANGNGRTARLLMNLILINKGYCIVSIPPVLRHEYIEALQVSQREKNPSIEAFNQLIAECELEAQKDYLRMFRIK
ncbi:Fic family protein [Anaerovorax odorimutans]|uniref:Fic family protein n=1 Tax=Anaerovorax odorimutans TaxID=109327 RepID=UPI0003F716B7|nr:Fic family protein [Anaerovorax odorimutans]